jgi:hypothetical protein
MLALYTVDSLADSDDNNFGPGQFTLREAIGQANANTNVDVIDFAPGLTGTISRSGGGVLSITNPVSITGPGAGQLTIDANQNGGVFDVTNAGAVNISKLTVTDGLAVLGGGLANSNSTVTLQQVHFVGNRATAQGGAIRNANASLVIRDCTFSNNLAEEAGAIYCVGVALLEMLLNSMISCNI